MLTVNARGTSLLPVQMQLMPIQEVTLALQHQARHVAAPAASPVDIQKLAATLEILSGELDQQLSTDTTSCSPLELCAAWRSGSTADACTGTWLPHTRLREACAVNWQHVVHSANQSVRWQSPQGNFVMCALSWPTLLVLLRAQHSRRAAAPAHRSMPLLVHGHASLAYRLLGQQTVH